MLKFALNLPKNDLYSHFSGSPMGREFIYGKFHDNVVFTYRPLRFFDFFQLRIEFLVLSYQIRRSILVFPGQLFLYIQMMLIFFRNSYSFPYFKPFEKKFRPLRFRAPYFETFLLKHFFCKS